MKDNNNSDEIKEINNDWKDKLEEYSGIKVGDREENNVVNKKSKIPKNYNEIGYVYILLDTSGSMNVRDKISQAKRGAISFIEEAYNLNYKTGIIEFASHPKEIANFNSSLKNLQTNLYKLEAGGSTNLQSALILARNRLKKLSGKKVVYIITDGKPDYKNGSKSEANILKEQGVHIMTLGTKDADSEFLKEISSDEGLSEITNDVELEENISKMSSNLPEDI